MFGEVIILEQIIEYIKQNYNPISIIIYGSYADGTNNLNSDFVQIFDGKIIVDSNERGQYICLSDTNVRNISLIKKI